MNVATVLARIAVLGDAATAPQLFGMQRNGVVRPGPRLDARLVVWESPEAGWGIARLTPEGRAFLRDYVRRRERMRVQELLGAYATAVEEWDAAHPVAVAECYPRSKP